ncbi:membrane protein [Nocardioides flavus (ex Wang et al. 2016)]|uniref:Membrane protein n=1 Tax=Nocardioides flavus (ex Wang et al. 2016) TaxID=2058780 RepID=A0ABQ3HP95_9ACTN|nr:phage holin family protein [Nocardioides flavus (ex Wang et al. 2016)]GHE19361.1 membrane protein [Nocardioides flavus (ex Wang et al. 2016)]
MTSQHGAPESQTLGALVHQLSQQIPELVRSEIRLAQAEVAQKGKHVGIGAGMFGAAGLLGFLALGSFTAAAILGLALLVDAWVAALLVGVVLLGASVAVGLLGKEQVGEATPAAPERAIHGLKEDVATVKGDHRD